MDVLIMILLATVIGVGLGLYMRKKDGIDSDDTMNS